MAGGYSAKVAASDFRAEATSKSRRRRQSLSISV